MKPAIDKIKNYNQIILAISGTIGLIMLLVIGTFSILELSRSLFPDNRSNQNGILSIEETKQLQKDSLRKQIISFNKIQVVDSAQELYILPVTQANLAAAEKERAQYELMNTKSIGGRYDRFHGNIYNNLILYDQISDNSNIIFDQRVSIKKFILHESSQNTFVIIPACNIDSNKDGYLNEDDLQELFIYNIKARSLHKIKAQENYTTLRVHQPAQSNDLVAHFGIDRNRDGTFNRSTEPMIFYRINLQTMNIEEYINPEQLNKLQALLEGK